MNIFSSIFGKKTPKDTAIKVLDSQSFKKMISGSNVQLIDVRKPDEFLTGHLEGAKNIDFYSGKFNVEFNNLDKEKPIFIYCRSGARSKQTAEKIAEMGFKEIYDLKGGMLNYK